MNKHEEQQLTEMITMLLERGVAPSDILSTVEFTVAEWENNQ